MDGFINVNKPLGRTSSDVVVFIRKRLPRGVRVGHGGTLDPEAGGVLPVCVGGAARLFDYIIDKEKTYVATLKLGQVTTTQDATGEVVEEHEVNSSRSDIERVLPRFVGEIEQIPPMYSAIKKDGRRLYQLARKGEAVDIPARKCVVHGIELLDDLGDNRYKLSIRCGKGVYIRTLCHDIGAALGCGGHMATLERVQAGAFRIEDALTLEQIDEMYREGRLEEALTEMDMPLQHIPRVDTTIKSLHAVLNGNPLREKWLKSPAPEGPVRIYMDGSFCGIGEKDSEGLIRFRAMLYRQSSGENNTNNQ